MTSEADIVPLVALVGLPRLIQLAEVRLVLYWI